MSVLIKREIWTQTGTDTEHPESEKAGSRVMRPEAKEC